jgi:alkylation response protein AidB-like acyl-CoA dehydrogenase
MTLSTIANRTLAGFDWTRLAGELGPRFAERGAEYDAQDRFVAENFAELKERRVFSAGVPSELAGGGAPHHQLFAMLRTLGRSCGSTVDL